MRARVRTIFQEAQAAQAAEDAVHGASDLAELGDADKPLDSQMIAQAAERINEGLRQRPPADKKATRQLAKNARHLQKQAAQLAKYEGQEDLLAGRSNCSATDPDARSMPMKQSRDFKPGYNLQVSAAEGFVTSYSLGNNPNDGASLIGHLERAKRQGLPQPAALVTDAGFGYEQNYAYVEAAGIEPLMKYPDWRREHTNRTKDAYHKSRFTYDGVADTYRCPQGQLLEARPCGLREAGHGYQVRLTQYQPAVTGACGACPVREACCRGAGDKSLSVSHRVEAYKAEVRVRLQPGSPGAALYARRAHEVETVFADMKAHRGYRRLRMRGLAKNTLDLTLYFLGHNLRKLASLLAA